MSGATAVVVDPVTPTDDGVRVEYVHATATEWYLRQGAGVEQGITLAASPEGKGRSCSQLPPPAPRRS